MPEAPIDAGAGFDNYAAGVAVGRHLLAQGRQRLAFIGGDDPRATRRWRGFHDTVVTAGLAAPQRLILARDASAGAAALASLPGIDAVFAANDAHAIGLMSSLRRAGLLVAAPGPAQPVAVVGLGDLEMGRLIAPALSTVRVHGMAIGKAAAGLTQDRDPEGRRPVAAARAALYGRWDAISPSRLSRRPGFPHLLRAASIPIR